MIRQSWEYGSDYHFISNYVGLPVVPWVRGGILTFSGRTALLILLEHLTSRGEFRFNSGTVWLPAYTCDQVAHPLQAAGYSVRFWDGNPIAGWDWPLAETREGDLWLLHNYFGLAVPGCELIPAIRERGVRVVEDHSHSPLGELAYKSNADYVFASLRKTLPLPDGGVLWSPCGHSLPISQAPAPTPGVRIAAMLGKASYLRGEPFPKSQYREWFLQAEADLGRQLAIGASEFSQDQLSRFDTIAWETARDRNLRWLWENMPQTIQYTILRDPTIRGAMGLVLCCRNRETRNHLREFLAMNQIYGAVLWPLPDGVSDLGFPRATDFQQRMLFIHADGRYGADDLKQVCDRFEDFLRSSCD